MTREIPVIVLQPRGGIGRRLTLRSADGRRPGAGPAGRPPAELADVAGDARRQPGGLGRGGRALRGLVRRGRRADPVRRDQPVRRRDRAHRRPPRPLPAGDPPPVRRRPRHALALEPGRRRGRRRRLQPAHARARRAPDRGDRGAGALDRGRRPRHARTSSTARPTSSTPAAARSSGSRTSTPGPRSSPACWPRAGGSSCSRAIRPSGCSTSTTTAAGSRPTTTTSAAPRRRRAGRPSTSTGCRSPTTTRAGSSPAPGRSARSSPRCSAPACGSRRSPSTRSTGGAATPTCAPRSAAGSRCRSRSSGEARLTAAAGRAVSRRGTGRPATARRRCSTGDDRWRGRSARRCADTASPGRRTATGRRARRGPAVSARNGRGSARVVAVERRAERRRRRPCSG